MTKHQQLQLANRTSRKCRLCVYASLVLVISLTMIKMVLSNRAATWGKTLDSLKQETNQIKQTNLNLRTQLAQKTGGLLQLESLAQQNGFISNPTIKYFPGGISVAQKMP